MRYNVSRLKNVAKTQHQANTNIHKTLNWATAPFQKIPKPAIFLNRCCRLHNIFGTYKIKRNVYPQSSDCHAKYIFTQSLVSGFHFTTDFPENVFSAQSLSTKFGSVFNFPQSFGLKIVFKLLKSENCLWRFPQSLVSVFLNFFGWELSLKVFHKVWFQFSIITQDFSFTNFINFLAKKYERSVLCKFGKYIVCNVPRLVFRWQIQHQANTNIHKLLN